MKLVVKFGSLALCSEELTPGPTNKRLDGYKSRFERFAEEKKYLAPVGVLTRIVYPVDESLQRLKFGE